MKVSITDFVINPNIEKKILKKYLCEDLNFESDILLVWHKICNKKYLEQFKNLKLIIRYGVGFENIDLNYCKKKKIIVCNTPHYGVDEVSDTAIAFLMDSTRRISEYNQIMIDLKKMPKDWQSLKIHKINRSSNIKVCSIGVGRIGSSFLIKAKAIGFKTYFYDPYKESGYEKVLNAKQITNLDDALKNMDVISLHCPLNKETKNILAKNLLLYSKKNQIIINTARGDLINFNYLAKSIYDNGLKFYLDVINEEPPLKNHIFFEWQNSKKLQKKLIINPHTAFYSRESYKEMRSLAALNIKNYILNPNNLKNRIN